MPDRSDRRAWNGTPAGDPPRELARNLKSSISFPRLTGPASEHVVGKALTDRPQTRSWNPTRASHRGRFQVVDRLHLKRAPDPSTAADRQRNRPRRGDR